MKNRDIKYKLKFIVGVLIMGLTIGSCESYLDKAPESIITDKDAFSNFRSFQGFVETMFYKITIPNEAGWGNSLYLFADETLNNYPYQFDLGNYWNQDEMLDNGQPADQSGDRYYKRVWPCSWAGIRIANMALSKLHLLTDATQEEKDLIEGQALFFRGWFHFELMRYWGGLPYIDTLLPSSGNINLPRLNYRETALRAAKDFERAAALLPANWDDTQAGQTTLGDNRQRISKVFALAYLGKDLLYAASPMMNEESTGNASFDTELCKRAAKAFADAIQVCTETGAFKLQSWATWTDNFWVWSPGEKLMSGGTEVIMNPICLAPNGARWNAAATMTPVQMGGYMKNVEVPTHNYIKNYAMANGLPIDDPLSGFNPNDPWVGREPRFYKDIIIDGDELVASTAAGPDRYVQLFNGGRHRGGTNGSVTGYFYKKFSPKGCNQWENKWDQFQMYVPFLRLADVYLMYAEAVLQGYGTPSSSVPGSITAEEALNVIRNRAQLPNIDSKFTGTKDAFMGEIIRERAVELAFEGQRWFDLRRWNLAGETKYEEKTAIDFDRAPNGKPINLKERVVITRVFEKKHNWLPFRVSYTKLYPEFPQNPGW